MDGKMGLGPAKRGVGKKGGRTKKQLILIPYSYNSEEFLGFLLLKSQLVELSKFRGIRLNVK